MTPRSDGYIPPCIPTRPYQVPTGDDCIHEIKHDGYRLQVRRDGDPVRLFTRRGAAAIRRWLSPQRAAGRSFTLDDEAPVRSVRTYFQVGRRAV
jgi:bifunctional non-homologous end joining protein LigD